MSEKQIRDVIREVCEDLERSTRRLRSGARTAMLGAALGAGLALGGCSDDTDPTAQPLYGVPDAAVEQQQPGMDAMYMAPFDLPPPAEAKVPGPDAAYMGPDAGVEAGPQPDYMAPDGGSVLLYMAPDTK